MTGENGELGLALFDDQYIEDPHSLYERMHDRGPVHRIGESSFYAVSGWDAVNDAIARCDDFSSNLTATMTYQEGTVSSFPMGELGGPTQVLATADDPDHAIHRRALLRQLAAKRIRAFEPFIFSTATEMWQSEVASGDVEWMGSVANRLPMMIVARIIGVPDEDIDRLVEWGYAATQFVEGLVAPAQLAQAGAQVMELGAYISTQFEVAASDAPDNLLGDLAAACRDETLDQIAALTIMITLFSAGGESTASLLGSAAWVLSTQPQVQQQLRDQPELLSDFLEETLRYEPPFRGHYRHVVNDTELGGVELAAGSRLLLLWGAANRDPSHFEAPEQFRLDRPAGRSHITFGKGAHFCVGAALARMEAKVVIGHMMERTSQVEAKDVGRWLPSLLVRRLESLNLVMA
ncbi:cytochrome P450 [Mycobacterium sp. 236(2023)]|uniref:cytochrome P450 n=1 Tax=Mycobacterium sp. 236(2023) TaxID=3038163 RepID=UPI0024155331|nr:cytochrome P450 [Mycobacterium sp. 236(2023)]MDG4669261.1 cytochrome P450 [Mycobacterium sp. 236(2023)]